MNKAFLFLNVKQNIFIKDYLKILLLIFTSCILSYILVFITKYVMEEIQFNIFKVIPIYIWMYLISVSILSISVVRTLLLSLFIRNSFQKTYFMEMNYHIIKYGFLSMPLLFPIILIYANQIVFNIVHIEVKNSLYLGIVFLFLFLMLWIFFLGTTIKSFLENKYSKMKSFFINIFTSFLTSLLVGVISFSYFIDVKQYEKSFYSEALDTLNSTMHFSAEQISFLRNQVTNKE